MVVSAWIETSSIWVQNLAAPHYYYLQYNVFPIFINTWRQMNVPSWDVYSKAVHESFVDISRASQSTFYLLDLTFRPLLVLLWILLQFFGRIAKILFHHLFRHGWISLQKGAVQAKAGCVWFYKFQRSLSREQVIGEIALCVSLVAIYYFQKWLRRQTYGVRIAKWFRLKKRRAIEHYNKVVHRVAQVSIVLAMALPHATFLGGVILVKLFVPRLVTWLATDTYAIFIISVLYPFIWTIALIHSIKYPSPEQENDKENAAPKTPDKKTPQAMPKSVQAKIRQIEKSSSSSSTSSPSPSKLKQQPLQPKKSLPSYMRSTSAQKARESQTTARKRGTKTGLYPRTTPTKSSPSPSSARQLLSPQAPSSFVVIKQDLTEFWLRYWVVFACVQGIGRVASLIPIFGSFVAKHPYILSIMAELKLAFFIWVFAMDGMLGQINASQDPLLSQALPLNMIHRFVTPVLDEFEAMVASSISKETWQNMVVAQAKRILEVFVMVRFLSEAWKNWIVHMLEEGQSFVVPSITLLMPGFITEFGVAYVSFAVPSAKSVRVYATGEKQRLLFLQYWVLHCVFAGWLSWFSSILWWIPFSTHATFLLWCHLSFPQTIVHWYEIFESELQAFGLLPKPDHVEAVAIENTRTAQLFHAIAKRLPSATDEAFDENDDDNGSERTYDDDYCANNKNDNDNSNRSNIDAGNDNKKSDEVINVIQSVIPTSIVGGDNDDNNSSNNERKRTPASQDLILDIDQGDKNVLHAVIGADSSENVVGANDASTTNNSPIVTDITSKVPDLPAQQSAVAPYSTNTTEPKDDNSKTETINDSAVGDDGDGDNSTSSQSESKISASLDKENNIDENNSPIRDDNDNTVKSPPTPVRRSTRTRRPPQILVVD